MNYTSRTATIKSANYSTMVRIGKSVFYEMCNSFPDIFIKMKDRAYKYNDPWKRFKKVLISQIKYLDVTNFEEFDQGDF